MNDQRQRRPDPPRTAPHRRFVFGAEPATGATRTWTSRGADGEGQIDAVISDAIDLGYRVFEEQMRQGQRAAQRFRQDALHSGAVESEVKNLIRDASRVTKGAIDAWVDLLSAARSSGAPRGSAQRGAAAFTVRVNARKPAQATLDLRPLSSRFTPKIQEMKGDAVGKASLTDFKFSVSADGRSGALVINVPDNAAAGVYTGDIVDSVTGEFGGTISVKIDP